MAHTRTQIICTLGPASSDLAVVGNMMRAGMDVARLNFSHGTHGDHRSYIAMVRSLNKKYHRRVKILQDLEGYRIRIGTFKNGQPVELKKRHMVFLVRGKTPGKQGWIPFDYPGSLHDIKTGNHIFIDDGTIMLLVKSVSRQHLLAEVIRGGLLKERKGVNLPQVELKFKGLTQKDRIDLEFGLAHGLDYVAQSFVRTKDDILRVKDIVRKRASPCKIIAKIENRQGIDNIDEILDVSDGIMVARGDMGISVPIYEIPVIQKMIIKKCNQRKKFVITATQMLESMTEHLIPTRAEVTDMANAILDGSDFLMLSAETAAGKHPVESVRMMHKVVQFTESAIRQHKI